MRLIKGAGVMLLWAAISYSVFALLVFAFYLATLIITGGER
jgi:hypothetical protein